PAPRPPLFPYTTLFRSVAFVALRAAERSGLRRKVHRVSEERLFAVELRVSLLALFVLAAIAVWTHVSIMLAGFSLGLAVSAVGEDRKSTRLNSSHDQIS